EDDLAAGIGALDRAIPRELDADRAPAGEDHAMHQRAGDDLQIAPLRCRFEISAGGTRPAPAAAGLLAPADAVPRTRRQVVDVRAYSSPSSWAAAMIAWHAAGRSLIGEVVRNPPEPCGSLASPCQ